MASSDQPAISPEVENLITEINQMGNDSKLEIMKKLISNPITSDAEALLVKQALANLANELLRIGKSSPIMQQKLMEVFSGPSMTGNIPTSSHSKADNGKFTERDSRIVLEGQSNRSNDFEELMRRNQKRSYEELNKELNQSFESPRSTGASSSYNFQGSNVSEQYYRRDSAGFDMQKPAVIIRRPNEHRYYP